MLIPGFYLLLAALVALIFTAIQKVELPVALRQQYTRQFAIAIAGWLIYSTVLTATGFFQHFSFPPRIALFLILPAFALFAYFFLSKKYDALIRAVPRAWPVYFQSFRIAVELLILGIYWKGMASAEPTLEGYNFDMVAGVTAPVVAYFVVQRKVFSSAVLKAWNIFGLLLLANVVIIFNTLLLKPELWGYSGSPVRPEFGTMPYLLIASFFMPCAVFMHIFSLVQLRKREEV